MTTETKRIDLPSGGWADVRTAPLKVRDLKEQRKFAIARGWGETDPGLNGYDVIMLSVKAWSFGEVDEATFDDLDVADLNAIAAAMPSVGEAPSTSSSAGGTATRRTPRPSNG